MKKIIIFLSLVILILVIFIYFQHKNSLYKKIIDRRYPFTLDKNQIEIEEEIYKALDFVDDLNATLSSVTNTEPMDSITANNLHNNFYNIPRPIRVANQTISDTTRAVLFTLPKLIRAVMDHYHVSEITDPRINIPDAAFYVYYGKYDGSNISHKYQSTCIIQLADYSTKRVLDNEIYDFGDLCPRVCPPNEQIID